MNRNRSELWLLRYLDKHCTSPDQSGCISIDRHWTSPADAKTDHGKTIASNLDMTCDQLDGLVSRLEQFGLAGKRRSSTSLSLWITAAGQDEARGCGEVGPQHVVVANIAQPPVHSGPSLVAPLILLAVAVSSLIASFCNTPVRSEVWWVASAICAVLAVWLPARKKKKEQQQTRRNHDCLLALNTIRQELGNFDQIAQARRSGDTFSGLHKRAVEVYSFEKTADVLVLLKKYLRYRWLAIDGLREIQANKGKELNRMEIDRLLDVLASLEKKLVAELSTGTPLRPTYR